MTSIELLKMLRHDFDQALAAHDPGHPNHRSHGGQHHNGPCCPFGNVNPGALIAMKRWRDEIDYHLKCADHEEWHQRNGRDADCGRR